MPARNARPSAAAIEEARAILVALETQGDYAPTNPAYTIPALRATESNLTRLEEAEIRAIRALAAIREEIAEEARRFYGLMLGTKTQVLAQYGDDSPVVHVVGLKRRSERKRPARRAHAAQ